MLQAKIKRTAPTSSGLGVIPLMEGEEVEATVGVNADGTYAASDVLLLTDTRIICRSGSDSKRSSSFVAVSDIDAVEFTQHQTIGYSAYVWAGLAFIVSFMLWRVIENQTISIAAAAVVAIMGIYLIIDRLTTRGEHVLILKAGGAELRVELDEDGRRADAEVLIARLFELKEERSSPQFARASKFSPR